ncbi:Ty3/gypsy retrotransposon protein [Quillaja saponaria]|uniref:Ty3/gypsy retrotransposon protein n=1 Tax=Quillaja saponaria TaxID=32244 RepID=A0AAD7PXT3_QUISA|nr:Ty3/gypsy retrotransposon protein [Quillaja saponaria]
MATNLFWKGMRKDIRAYVRACAICQQSKYETAAQASLLQPLPIPERVWTDSTIDFIEGLPKSEGKKVILVVVDRLSKYAHLLALAHPFTAISVAQAFMDTVFKITWATIIYCI